MNGLTEAQTPVNGHQESKDAVELGTGHGGPETWDAGLREVWDVSHQGSLLLRSPMNGEQSTPKLRLKGTHDSGTQEWGAGCKAQKTR